LYYLYDVHTRRSPSLRNRPSIESFLLRVDGDNQQPPLDELIAVELHYRRQKGELIAFLEYQTQFPGLSQLWFEETIQRMPDQSTDRSIDYGPDDASGLKKLLKYLQLH